MKIYLLLLLSSLLASLGQIFLKKGADSLSELSSILNIYLFSGIVLYILGFLIWVYSLSKVSLSVVYGFTLLTFIFVFVFSYIFLGEKISILALLGLLFVFMGFSLIVKGQVGV